MGKKQQTLSGMFLACSMIAALILCMMSVSYASQIIDLNTSPANLSIYSNFRPDDITAGDINGDGIPDIAMGTIYADPLSRTDAGAVYIVYGANSLPATLDITTNPANITIYGAQSSDKIGDSLAFGDINNDGIDDMLIGIHYYSAGIRRGKALAIFGGQHLPSTIDLSSYAPNRTIYGENEKHYAGQAVYSCDLNNDNFDDIIIGAPGADPQGGTDAGKVYVKYGSASPSQTVDLNTTAADVTILGNDPDDELGSRVHCADVNGDGKDDLIVGDNKAGYLGNWAEVNVLYGSNLPSVINLNPNALAANFTVRANISDCQMSTGDVNRDGLDDFMFGNPWIDAYGRDNAGEGYVVLSPNRSAYVLDIALGNKQPNVTLSGAQAYDMMRYVSAVDINNDDYSDFAAASYIGNPLGRSDGGIVYIVLGQPKGYPQSYDLESDLPNITIYGESGIANLGFGLFSGDINNDGLDDLIMGYRLGARVLYGWTNVPWAPPNQSENDGTLRTDLSAMNMNTIRSIVSYVWHRNNKAKIQFLGTTNLSGISNLNPVIEVGQRFAFVNSSGYRNLNKTANITFYGVNCSDSRSRRIYHSETGDTLDAILASGTLCTSGCTNVQCAGGQDGNLSFMVSHFTGYASGVNANLTIYDDIESGGIKFTGEDIVFSAEYTNSASHISGASCNISFDDAPGAWHVMSDNGASYNYTKAGGFSSDGAHLWNVTCDHASYSQLDTTDTINITSPPVPEFSSMACVFALMVIMCAGIIMRHRQSAEQGQRESSKPDWLNNRQSIGRIGK